MNTPPSGIRDRFRLPDLEDYPNAEPYCTRCKDPVGRARIQGRLAHLAGEDAHPVELGWRPRDGAGVTP